MSHAEDAYKTSVATMFEERLKRAGSGGRVIDDPTNILLYLAGVPELMDLVAMDRFSHRIVCERPPPWREDGGDWSEPDMIELRVYLAERHGALFSLQNIEHAVISAANKRATHPVRAYLEGLDWDGESRLDTWLGVYLDATRHATQTTREYVYQVGRMWLIAAIARVFEPGCKFDNVLILEGDQGIGKSTALAILGGTWFTDTPFRIGDKDGYGALQGRWIVELPELENFSGVDSSRAKAFFSSREDNYRPPYARRNQEFPRQCVFAGTTNQAEYLKDATGNRRYWPVRVGRLDRDALVADRDQLWAEALERYRQGVAYHLEADDPAWAVFTAEQEARSILDPWEQRITEWLANRSHVLTCAGKFTVFDVLRHALDVDVNRMDQRSMATRVGKILKKLGCTKRRYTSAADRARFESSYYYEAPDKGEKVRQENA